MKKLTVTLSAILMVSASFGQIEKGAWLLGASTKLGYNSYSFKNSTSDLSIFDLNSKQGYFIANNFAVGLNLNYFSTSQSSSKSSLTTLGVFTRYYFPKNFFLGAGISRVWQSSSSGSFSGSSASTVIPFELGFAGFVSRSIAIEPSLNYVKGDEEGGVTFNGLPIGATSSFGVSIGFAVYLNRGEQ